MKGIEGKGEFVMKCAYQKWVLHLKYRTKYRTNPIEDGGVHASYASVGMWGGGRGEGRASNACGCAEHAAVLYEI